MDHLTATNKPHDFADTFLRAKDLPWAADALAAFPDAVIALDVPQRLPGTEAVHVISPAKVPAKVAQPVRPTFGFDAALPERFSPFRVPPKPNRAARRKAAHSAATAIAIALLLASSVPRPASALTVFDPLNYQENVLSAVRALEQINNQVRQLQNQVQMITRMDQNLRPLGSSLSSDLQRSLAEIQSRLQEGQGLAMKFHETEAGYAQLFPQELSTALSTNDVLRNAKTRWDEDYASLQRSAMVQGQIADSIGADTGLLDDAMARSRNAGGALEVAQAGNELSGLGVKQSLQLQGLLAAQARAETIRHARDLAAEDEARQRFKTFLGTGPAYAAGP